MSGSMTATRERPRALQQINLNAMYDAEQGTSSEEELSQAPHKSQSDAQTLVGLSLGPEQSRLTNPTTPAVEKAAAIEAGGGFFADTALGNVPETDDDTDSTPKENLPPDVDERGRLRGEIGNALVTRMGLPSPWRAGPKTFRRADEVKGALRDITARRRSTSGPIWENWHKSIMSNMHSLPKVLTASSPFSSKRSNSNTSNRPSPGTLTDHRDLSMAGPPYRTRSRSEANALELDRAAPQPREQAFGTSTGRRSQLSRADTYKLRRSVSDRSLSMSAISRVSTLGDDSRFEHVSTQVNSRAKAIRDSFQDSNIKFPSLSSLSLDSFKPDFSFHAKNNSSKRPIIDLPPQHISLNGNGASADQFSPTPSQTTRNLSVLGAKKEGGPTPKTASTHPHFTKACAEMTGDVVILGGYRGSILRSADPPHIQLWAPVKVGLGIRKVDLELGLNVPEDDKRAEAKIIPGGMLTHIGPVDISKRLFRRLRACENSQNGSLRVHDYGYDWRLDPEYLSDRFIEFLEKLPCNKTGMPKAERGATVIAHSLGGLITRHAVNRRPELFAGVVYAGTPTRCVNILGPLRTGDDVLLSSRVLTAQVNLTIRTSFALLPLDGRCFFNKETQEEFPVDFFNPQTWADYRLSPCFGLPLPPSEPPSPSMIESFLSTLTSSMPSFASSRRASVSGTTNTSSTSDLSHGNHDPRHRKPELEPSGMSSQVSSNVSTQVSIPPEDALRYLTTMLARVKRFKQDLDHRPAHAEANAYPPQAVIYGKSTPTVYGAKVKDREGIRRSTAYDNLAFASGDGVVLAKAAMLPAGYKVARGGLVSSERGHITLLGDLEAVGRCLNAVRRARSQCCGLGKE